MATCRLQLAAFTLTLAVPLSQAFGEPNNFRAAAEAIRVIDQNWLQRTLHAPDYCLYRNERFALTEDTAVRYSMLALADSFTQDPNWSLVQKSWLFDSNPYSAAAFFNALQTHFGNPSQGHYHVEQIVSRHHNRNIPEIEAAMFAHVQDEKTYFTYMSNELGIFGPTKVRGERNMYAAIAKKLRTRNQAYMNDEWKRLWQFTNNLHIKKTAFLCVRDEELPGASDFTALVREIQKLHDRLGRSDIDTSTPQQCSEVVVRLVSMEFDVSNIRCGTNFFYSVPGLSDKYCERLTNRRALRRGLVSLKGSPENLSSMGRLFAAVKRREKCTIEFDENRVAVVFPTHKLSDQRLNHRFFFLNGVVGSTTAVVLQNVLVVHLHSEDESSALEILEAADGNSEAIVPWSDGTFIGLMKTPVSWADLGVHDFIVQKMPLDEDFRKVEWRGSSDGQYVLLKASEKGVARIKSILQDSSATPASN